MLNCCCIFRKIKPYYQKPRFIKKIYDFKMISISITQLKSNDTNTMITDNMFSVQPKISVIMLFYPLYALGTYC